MGKFQELEIVKMLIIGFLFNCAQTLLHFVANYTITSIVGPVAQLVRAERS